MQVGEYLVHIVSLRESLAANSDTFVIDLNLGLEEFEWMADECADGSGGHRNRECLPVVRLPVAFS